MKLCIISKIHEVQLSVRCRKMPPQDHLQIWVWLLELIFDPLRFSRHELEFVHARYVALYMKLQTTNLIGGFLHLTKLFGIQSKKKSSLRWVIITWHPWGLCQFWCLHWKAQNALHSSHVMFPWKSEGNSNPISHVSIKWKMCDN